MARTFSMAFRRLIRPVGLERFGLLSRTVRQHLQNRLLGREVTPVGGPQPGTEH